MQYRLILALLALALTTGQVTAAPRLAPVPLTDPPSIIRIGITSLDQVRDLVNAGADVCAHGKGWIDVVLPPHARLLAHQSELARRIAAMPDVRVIQADADAGPRRIMQQPDLGGYHSLDMVKADLDAACQKYPQICRQSVIGKSVEGRDIWALRISGAAQDGVKPAFLFTGLHHSREWISVEVPMGLIAELTGKYATDPTIKQLVDEREIWIVPVVNPDGLNYSQTQYTMWRKNRRDNGNGVFGVDVNRNYGYKWGGDGSSDNPDSDIYRGPKAFSEPETQAIRTLAQDKKIKTALSFHSYSELVLWPWGYTSDPTPEAAVFTKFGQAMAQINGYTPEQSIDLYPTTGDFDDDLYGELGILAYTIELGKEFIPPQSDAGPIVQKNVQVCLYMLKEAADPFPMLNHAPLSDTINPTGPYSVSARLTHPRPGFDAPTAILHYRSGDGDWKTIPMTAGAQGTFAADIPGAGYTTHRYWIEVVGANGQTARFPEQGENSFRVVDNLVLIVANDGGKGYEHFYRDALSAAGIASRIVRVHTDAPVTAEDLAGATAVVWFTGEQYSGTLSDDAQALLKSYLDKGGKLALFGEDIGYDLKDTPFYKDVLKAKWIKDTAGSTAVKGTGPVEGLTLEIGASSDGIPQQYPDVIEALPGAAPLASYSDGTGAGLTVSSARSKIAYLGFGLEGVNGSANRQALLTKVLAWLSAPAAPR